MPLHGLSIATGQNEAGADTSRGADGAEYVGRLCALILRRPGPGSPRVHGAPIHFGDPSAIGFVDIDKPEFGGDPDIRPGETPLFCA